VTGDDLIGSPPDRQILVASDSIAGIALTGLLRRAGYDPVLVGGQAPTATSQVTYLWPPALQLLEAMDVDLPIRDRGYTVDSVSVTRATSQQEGPTLLSGEPESAAGAIVRTRDLRRVLEEELPDGREKSDRRIETLSERDDAVEVEFDDGVREWFDVVVGAGGGGSLLPANHPSKAEDYTTIAQYEHPTETGETAWNRLHDIWHPEFFTQLIPRPAESGALLRITTTRTDPVEALQHGNWDEAFPDELADSLPTEVSETDQTTVRQARQQRGNVSPDWWGTGRVAACGSAGFPVAPASGFQASLAIEDAWILAEELVRGPRSVSDVVDIYARRRSRRMTAILRRADSATPDHEYPLPTDLSSPLSTVGRLRVAALGSLRGSTMAVTYDVFSNI
jgi:2-polyprenyl-6-methoxyphenol hydroxylase-like FAD-dependent oxidoreductase